MPRHRPLPIGADVIYFVDPSELADPVPAPRRANPADGRGAGRKAPLRSTWKVDESSLRLYDGQEKFLVRTALLRATGYSERSPMVSVTSSRDVVKLCAHLAHADQEHLVVLSLNIKLQIHAIFEVALGGGSSVGAERQHVLKVPLLTGAESVVLVHNHPSGDPTPSPEDTAFTREIRAALQCIDLPLHDHVIVARNGSFSFLDAGLIPPLR